MNIDIVQAIEQGFTIVTPTKRLARVLQQHYTATQLAQQKQVWETPDISPWTACMARLWQQVVTQQTDDSTILLNTVQQQLIWQQIVDDSDASKTLLQTSSIASQAYTSLKKMCQWQLPVFPSEYRLSQECIAFRTWVDRYQQHCEKNHWLDLAGIEGALNNIINQGLKSVAVKLYLIGFDELTPAQQALLHNLEKAGNPIKQMTPISNPLSTVKHLGFNDKETEIKALAHWIRAELQADPNTSIGVIVPELSSDSENLRNTLDDILVPSALLSINDHQQRPYNISLGKPLLDHPLIHTALNILDLQKPSIRLNQLGELLRTPFIVAAEKEMSRHAELDAKLREQGASSITLTALQQGLQKEPWRSSCPELAAALKIYAQLQHQQPTEQSHTAWAQAFTKLLAALSWPGERRLHSDEYQLMEAWQQALSQFASLDLISEQINRDTALSLLRQQLRQHIHQPASAAVPVQIMGLFEATGLQFDRLWITGLHSDNWPPPAQMDPFIPAKLQEQANMPHATPQYELEHARGMTQALASAGKQVIFSTSLNRDDQPLQASTLFKQWPLVDAWAAPLTDIKQQPSIDYAADIFNSSQLEYLSDEQGPAVESTQISGGTSLLKDQAACPFRAFARHRLAAKGLGATEIGLTPAQRGQLVHDCLHLFWQTITTQQQLQACTAEVLMLNIEETVTKAIKHFQARQYFWLSRALMRLEQQRLIVLLQQCLAMEKDRPAFTVIETEQKHSYQIADLEIHARTDRIDQLSDGSLVIIDYKTGEIKIAGWMGERPQEPQLPFYATNISGTVVAVAFIQLRHGKVQSAGLVNEEQQPIPLPQLKTLAEAKYVQDSKDWQQLLANWHQRLHSLAAEFGRGEARVDPYNKTTCQHCDLGILCRVDELR